MKIIYRYLFKKFLGPFALTFFFALFILLMQFVWKYVDDMVGKGIEVSIILELLFYCSATFVSTAIPLAVLLSSLMTFGTLGERYEIIAMKAAGISIKKLIFSLSFFVFLIACGSFWFSDNIAPKSYLKFRTLLSNIMDQKPALSIEEGVFYDGFENFVIRVGKKDRNNVDIYDVLIFEKKQYQGNNTFTYAKRGKMELTSDKAYLLFYLYNGFFWDENPNAAGGSNTLTRSVFSEQYNRFDLSSFKFEKTEHDFYAKAHQALSNKELEKNMDTVKKNIKNTENDIIDAFLNTSQFYKRILNMEENVRISRDSSYKTYKELSRKEKANVLERVQILKDDFNNTRAVKNEYKTHLGMSLGQYKIEWYRKYAMAVSCILFFFIGAPLGSIIRKGGIGVPLVITVVFFSSYFMFSVFGEKIAKGGAIPVWLGMWMSTMVLLPIGVFLTYQASVDSALLSSEEIHKKIQQFNLKKLFAKKNENPAAHT